MHLVVPPQLTNQLVHLLARQTLHPRIQAARILALLKNLHIHSLPTIHSRRLTRLLRLAMAALAAATKPQQQLLLQQRVSLSLKLLHQHTMMAEVVPQWLSLEEALTMRHHLHHQPTIYHQ